MMERFGIIYKITNQVNGKIYAGQTVQSLRARWSEHVRYAKRTADPTFALCRAMQKYGIENFKIEIVETVLESELNKREEFWIKELNSLCFGNGHGYNMTLGGHGGRGRIQSSEEKEKRSKSCTGRKHSQETKELMSRKMKGRKITWGDKVSKSMTEMLAENTFIRDRIIEQAHKAAEQNKKPVEAFISGTWVEFAGSEDLAKAIGAKAPNITNVIYGKADTVRGLMIRSKDTKIQALAEKNRLERKSKPHAHNKVICVETKEVFNSRREVSTIFNVSMKSVDDSVKRGYACRTKEHGKLHFEEMI